MLRVPARWPVRGPGQLPAAIEGRCWLDPRLDALADYLEQPGRPADRVAAALSAIAEHRDDPERRVQVTTAAAERLVDLTETTGELDEQARGSADGMSLLARALAFAAWKARTGGRISALPWDYQRGGTAAYQRAYATARPTGA